MRKTMSIFGLLLFSSTLFAKTPPEVRCTLKVEAAIKSTAKIMGLKEQFSVQLMEPEDAGKDMCGAQLKSYSSSAFIVNNGYISGSGATVVVQSSSISCEIIKMSISVGQ